MIIYSTRHGQTDWNAEFKVMGCTDIELNETGISQAYDLAKKISIDIDLIVCSPMKRALKTAEIVSEVNGGIEIITDKRLREWDYGSFEGTHYKIGDEFFKNKRQFGVRMKDGGESLLQLTHRVYSALDEIIEKYKDRTVLIVSHGGVARSIETYFNDMTVDEYSNWFMENCELEEYKIDLDW